MKAPAQLGANKRLTERERQRLYANPNSCGYITLSPVAFFLGCIKGLLGGALGLAFGLVCWAGLAIASIPSNVRSASSAVWGTCALGPVLKGLALLGLPLFLVLVWPLRAIALAVYMGSSRGGRTVFEATCNALQPLGRNWAVWLVNPFTAGWSQAYQETVHLVAEFDAINQQPLMRWLDKLKQQAGSKEGAPHAAADAKDTPPRAELHLLRIPGALLIGLLCGLVWCGGMLVLGCMHLLRITRYLWRRLAAWAGGKDASVTSPAHSHMASVPAATGHEQLPAKQAAHVHGKLGLHTATCDAAHAVCPAGAKQADAVDAQLPCGADKAGSATSLQSPISVASGGSHILSFSSTAASSARGSVTAEHAAVSAADVDVAALAQRAQRAISADGHQALVMSSMDPTRRGDGGCGNGVQLDALSAPHAHSHAPQEAAALAMVPAADRDAAGVAVSETWQGKGEQPGAPAEEGDADATARMAQQCTPKQQACAQCPHTQLPVPAAAKADGHMGHMALAVTAPALHQMPVAGKMAAQGVREARCSHGAAHAPMRLVDEDLDDGRWECCVHGCGPTTWLFAVPAMLLTPLVVLAAFFGLALTWLVVGAAQGCAAAYSTDTKKQGMVAAGLKQAVDGLESLHTTVLARCGGGPAHSPAHPAAHTAHAYTGPAPHPSCKRHAAPLHAVDEGGKPVVVCEGCELCEGEGHLAAGPHPRFCPKLSAVCEEV